MILPWNCHLNITGISFCLLKKMWLFFCHARGIADSVHNLVQTELHWLPLKFCTDMFWLPDDVLTTLVILWLFIRHHHELYMCGSERNVSTTFGFQWDLIYIFIFPLAWITGDALTVHMVPPSDQNFNLLLCYLLFDLCMLDWWLCDFLLIN